MITALASFISFMVISCTIGMVGLAMVRHWRLTLMLVCAGVAYWASSMRGTTSLTYDPGGDATVGLIAAVGAAVWLLVAGYAVWREVKRQRREGIRWRNLIDRWR